MMKTQVLLLAIFLVSLAAGAFAFSGGAAFQTPASAREPWLIRAFDATYDIKPDGRVEVTETIRVDFSGLDVNGIYRTLPIEVDHRGHDGQLQRRALKIEVERITAYSEPVPFTSKQTGGRLVLSIERDCTCRTHLEYQIIYTVKGALELSDDLDRFRWNVTGVWPVDILNTDARVVAPAIHNANCLLDTGEADSACGIVSESDNAVSFAADRVPSGVSLAINVALPKGSVDVASPLLIEPRSSWLGSPASLALAGALALLLIFIGLLMRTHLLRSRRLE